MRRKEQEIKDIKEIEEIIRKAQVCRLGLAVDNTPYVVPVNFGYDAGENCIYVHCAKEGRKLDMIKRNNTVCFEMDVDMEISGREKMPCNWSTAFRSVIGYGNAFIIDDFDEKRRALDFIMKQYSSETSFEYSKKSVENVGIVRIVITNLTGKKSD